MFNRGKIQGDNLFELMEQVQQSNTLLSMKISGKDYEQLTVINDIVKQKNQLFFVVDEPSGFIETISDIQVWKINFKFKGPDNLQYVFSTTGGNFDGQKITIPFPGYIERVQRRKNFRIDAPAQAMVLFKDGTRQHECSLINISLGGIFCKIARLGKGKEKQPAFMKGETLQDLELIFPPQEDRIFQNVKVTKAIVRRDEHDPEKDLTGYGLEFTGIDRDEKKNLTAIVYYLQRLNLQRK